MGFSKQECPCRWCEERTFDCHGKCHKYKEWCKAEDKQKKKIKVERVAEMLADQDRIEKHIKRKKKKL